MSSAAISPVNSSIQDSPQSTAYLPRVGITMGDPAGIGPEVVLKAVAEAEVRAVCQPIIIGDAQLLAHHARTLNLQCGYEIVRRDETPPLHSTAPLIFHLNNIQGHVEPGIESADAGRAAGEYIEAAVELMRRRQHRRHRHRPHQQAGFVSGWLQFSGHTGVSRPPDSHRRLRHGLRRRKPARGADLDACAFVRSDWFGQT